MTSFTVRYVQGVNVSSSRVMFGTHVREAVIKKHTEQSRIWLCEDTDDGSKPNDVPTRDQAREYIR